MNDEHRKNLVECFHGVSGMILFSFAKYELSRKDEILRNFVARTDMMLNSIFALWSIGNIQDCWIIHRCLLDRLFHIHHISKKNEFEAFDDWSFYQQYNANNRIASDKEFLDQTEKAFLKVTNSQKERYKKLSSLPPQWKRPHPERVAQDMGLSFLYKYGYDYGSTHVHPMANDGLEDFYTITKLEPKPQFPDASIAFSNSVLVATLIIQEILNASSFKWRSLVYFFLENLRKALQEHDNLQYQVDFMKIGKAFPCMGLCETN